MPSTGTNKAEDPTRTDRISRLRIELKEWEHKFAKAHDGRKPTREETKKESRIAAKYKEYARLRAALTSTSSRNASVLIGSVKSHSPIFAAITSPQKSVIPPILTQTPTKNTANSPWANESYESPLSTRRQRLFGLRDQVGPTPQKTGRVLGIFDSFIDVESTPPRSSRKHGHLTPGTPTKIEDRVSASPSTLQNDEDGEGPFSTPRKRKLEMMKTGSPLGKDDIFATPSALRRWKPPVAINGEFGSPPVRKPPSRPKRGLSSMLRELREMEHHALDDEEEVMREIEMEAAGDALNGDTDVPPLQPSTKNPEKKAAFDEAELPSAPPGAFVEESVAIESSGKDVEAPRVWKKKGLKRQHRRVIMRPVVVKPTTQPTEKSDDEQPIPSDIENGEDFASSDFEDEGNDDDEEGAPKSKKSKKAAEGEKSVVEKRKEVVKKAGRKISANAHSHMNFRRLNIKNKNSKGRGRGGGFGRRRR